MIQWKTSKSYMTIKEIHAEWWSSKTPEQKKEIHSVRRILRKLRKRQDGDMKRILGL